MWVCAHRDRLIALTEREAGAAGGGGSGDKLPISYTEVRDLLMREMNPEQEFRIMLRHLSRNIKDIKQVYQYYCSTGFTGTTVGCCTLKPVLTAPGFII